MIRPFSMAERKSEEGAIGSTPERRRQLTMRASRHASKTMLNQRGRKRCCESGAVSRTHRKKSLDCQICFAHMLLKSSLMPHRSPIQEINTITLAFNCLDGLRGPTGSTDEAFQQSRPCHQDISHETPSRRRHPHALLLPL